MDRVLSLDLLKETEVPLEDEHSDEVVWIESLIEARVKAKADRDFAKADAIRDELKVKGIILTDTAEGCKWSRI